MQRSRNKRINYFIYNVNKLYDIWIEGLKCSISFHLNNFIKMAAKIQYIASPSIND